MGIDIGRLVNCWWRFFLGSIYQLRTKFIIESEEEEGYWKIKRGKNIRIIVWRVRFGKIVGWSGQA